MITSEFDVRYAEWFLRDAEPDKGAPLKVWFRWVAEYNEANDRPWFHSHDPFRDYQQIVRAFTQSQRESVDGRIRRLSNAVKVGHGWGKDKGDTGELFEAVKDAIHHRLGDFPAWRQESREKLMWELPEPILRALLIVYDPRSSRLIPTNIQDVITGELLPVINNWNEHLRLYSVTRDPRWFYPDTPYVSPRELELKKILLNPNLPMRQRLKAEEELGMIEAKRLEDQAKGWTPFLFDADSAGKYSPWLPSGRDVGLNRRKCRTHRQVNCSDCGSRRRARRASPKMIAARYRNLCESIGQNPDELRAPFKQGPQSQTEAERKRVLAGIAKELAAEGFTHQAISDQLKLGGRQRVGPMLKKAP